MIPGKISRLHLVATYISTCVHGLCSPVHSAMQLAFITSLFFALVLPVFSASLGARDNCPQPTTCPPDKTCPPLSQFCSKCPRTNNAGNPLQGGAEQAAYTHCIYKDADCFYGPFGSPVKSISCYSSVTP